MDLPLLREGFEFSRRNKNRLLLIALFGATSYGAYRAYNSPYVVRKRKHLMKLLKAFVSIAEMLSNSADTLALVSNDLNKFLTSDSDQIPNSLKQLSKIATSNEFSSSLVRVSEALTIGILLGRKSLLKNYDNSEISAESSRFSDSLLEKLFSKAGTGFVSVVVGSFARNLVQGFFLSNAESANGELNAGSQLNFPGWLSVIYDERCEKLIGDCVQIFVSTAVAVYLDKTMNVNTYDEMFDGLTNPKHQEKLKGILVSLCNGAVETLVRTSHQVLTNPNPNSTSTSTSSISSIVGKSESPTFGCLKPEAFTQQLRIGSSVNGVCDTGWFEQIKSTMSVPANRRFMIDVTGRVTFETMRSFVEFLLWRMSDGFKKSLSKVHDEVVDKGLEVVSYVGAKSSVILTLCLAFFLHILGDSRILLSA